MERPNLEEIEVRAAAFEGRISAQDAAALLAYIHELEALLAAHETMDSVNAPLVLGEVHRTDQGWEANDGAS